MLQQLKLEFFESLVAVIIQALMLIFLGWESISMSLSTHAYSENSKQITYNEIERTSVADVNILLGGGRRQNELS